jgi:hypothetical protein
MNKHLDPAHRVYIDLDKHDKADLYDKYAKLVESYRELRSFASEMYDIIDEQVGEDWLDDDNLHTLNEFVAFRINPNHYTPVTPALCSIIVGPDGTALREEDK